MIGVTPLTLRNWDRQGKLVAYRHPINNYRVYRLDQLELFLRSIESPAEIRTGAYHAVPKKIHIRREE